MKVAFVTLSREGASLMPYLRREFGEIDCYVHEAAAAMTEGRSFAHIAPLTEEIFPRYEALIYAAPCGVVVRSLAGCVANKLTDPAVVVLDVGVRWAVSLLSGHEGGANDLSVRIANLFDAEAIITTTTETVKNLVVGIGCRRETECESIIDAIRESLEKACQPLGKVRLLASVDVKRHETGLLQAATTLGIPIRFISIEQIRHTSFAYSPSDFVRQSIGVPAVAEPVALIAGRRTRLILKRTTYDGVTVAIAQESCMSLE